MMEDILSEIGEHGFSLWRVYAREKNIRVLDDFASRSNLTGRNKSELQIEAINKNSFIKKFHIQV